MIYLAEKLKSLRAEKNVSQEKLALYLNVSSQAVSKWENNISYPDIQLLPDIARFFGVTIDELIQTEKIDNDKLYDDYSNRACDLFRDGRYADALQIWKEAYRKMPNDIRVKEMLMSSYFDADRKKYSDEIIEFGTQIYNSDADSYYRGQAISEVARVYAECGNIKKSREWVKKSFKLMHSQEIVSMAIMNDEEDLISVFCQANYWYLLELFYMYARFVLCDAGSPELRQGIAKTITNIYESVFANDDMDYEFMQKLSCLHIRIAQEETKLKCDTNIIRTHLERAVEVAVKSAYTKQHILRHPLVYGWEAQGAPSDNLQNVRFTYDNLNEKCFDSFRSENWFIGLQDKLSNVHSKQ